MEAKKIRNELRFIFPINTFVIIYLYYFWKLDSPVTRHPSPVTRHSSPVTRHLRKAPAAYRTIGITYILKLNY